jgi:hypothetical protein
MSPDVRWEIPQTIDTVDPLSSHYNPKSAYAKTLRRDGKTWGGVVADIVDPGRTNTADSKAGINRIHLAHDNRIARSATPPGRPVVSDVTSR